MVHGEKRRRAAEPPPQVSAEPTKLAWQEHLDPQERPNRGHLAAQRSVFDTILEPVPMPRWLRGRRRPPRDKLS